MGFFKFRKAGNEAVTPPAQPESAEALRKRARQRLIGSALLLLAGVIGFPLVFDTQPRPVSVDIPIDIPDRGKAAPLTPANLAVGTVVPASAPAPAASAPASAAPAAAIPAAPPPAVSAAPAAAPAVAAAPAAPPPAFSPSSGERAKALLEGRPVEAAVPAAAGRYVVQVGAFAEPARAAAARQKLEKAGLKTYTHVAETREGRRTRVRVGPFDTREEADKAAVRVKALDLPVTILTL